MIYYCPRYIACDEIARLRAELAAANERAEKAERAEYERGRREAWHMLNCECNYHIFGDNGCTHEDSMGSGDIYCRFDTCPLMAGEGEGGEGE